ncbi:hypothetical protein AT6N2_C2931 [Agrobacterium tumefaciens]|nr:hypothetical protein AT6N2_C2931 [Agrobacterium tumefaciens]
MDPVSAMSAINSIFPCPRRSPGGKSIRKTGFSGERASLIGRPQPVKITIGFLRPLHRQRCCLIDAARHCPRHGEGGEVAKLGEMNAAFERFFPGRRRKHGVAVTRQMGGKHGASQPVMRHNGKAMRLRFRECGIRHDRADGRCREVDALQAQGGIVRFKALRKPAFAKLPRHFKRRRPEVAARAKGCRAKRVDGDNSCHFITAGTDSTCRAEPSLEGRGRRPGSGADRPEFERRRTRRLESGISHLAIGRMQSPIFVTAVQQIHEDRLWRDGYAGRTHLKSAADLPQPGLNTACRIQPKGRAARQHEGIHRFHRHRRIEQADITPARRAAQNRTRGNDRLFENNRRHPGANGKIGDIADRNA